MSQSDADPEPERPGPAGSEPADLDVTPVRPAMGPGFSMGKAMIVPGLGALILFIFIGATFLTKNPVKPINHSTTAQHVAGTSFEALPGVKDLSVITVNGEPPGNILDSVSIPKGAQRISFENNTAAAGQYDQQIELIINATQGAINTFYLKDMKSEGWQIFEQGPADNNPGAIEVLGKKAGSDGFYWEMGAVTQATTFGDGAPAAGHTDFTVRLFQVPDPD